MSSVLDNESARVIPPPIASWHFDACVTGLVFARSGRQLAVGLGDGTIRLIDRDAAPADPCTVAAHTGALLCLHLDIGGDAFLSGGDDGRLVQTDASGRTNRLLDLPGQWIDTVAVSAEHRAVALGKEVRLLDRAGTEIGRNANHPSTVSGLAFNPKGKRLAVSHYGGVTLWWTSLGGTPKRLTWRGSHIGVSWSPDGNYLLTATQESELHGWRLADGADMRMSGYARKVRSFDWIAKPAYLLTAGSDTVVAWPFSGKGPMGKAPLEIGRAADRLVAAVAAHPNKSLFAFGYDDGEICVAELPGDRIVSIKPADGWRPSHMTWSPDGRAIAIGDDSGGLFVAELARR